MTTIPPKIPENSNTTSNVPTRSSQSPQQNPSNELGIDQVSISKEFSKGTSTGSAGALSNAKDTAKVDKPRQSEKVAAANVTNKVTPTKSAAASQADTGIKSQTDKQSRSISGVKGNDDQNKSIDSPQAMKTCPACKGIGCPNCKPEFAELFTQEERNRGKNAEETSRIENARRKKQMIEMIDEAERVARLKKTDAENSADRLIPPKKGNINTFAEK